MMPSKPVSSDPPRLSLVELARRLGTTVGTQTEPHSRRVPGHGLSLQVLEWGQPGKPAVVLCHAAEETAHSWDLLGMALADDYHVIAPDCRGFGGSDREPDGVYGREWDLRDMEACMDALRVTRCVLVGQARGARNAINYAGRHPERVRGIVLIDTSPELSPGHLAEVLAYLDDMRDVDSYERFVAKLQAHNPLRSLEQVRTMLLPQLQCSPEGKWNWNWDARSIVPSRDARPAVPGPSPWDRLMDLRSPTLLVRGGTSPIMTEDVAQRMLALIADSRLVTIERAGHLVAGDNPAEFERVLRAFFASLR